MEKYYECFEPKNCQLITLTNTRTLYKLLIFLILTKKGLSKGCNTEEFLQNTTWGWGKAPGGVMLWDGSPLTGSPPPFNVGHLKIFFFFGGGGLQVCSLSDNFTSESFLEIKERNLRLILDFVQNSKDFWVLSQSFFGMLLKQFETFCDSLS